MKQKQKKCRTCQRRTLHLKSEMIPHSVHAILILLTCGSWLLLAIPLVFLDLFQPSRCQLCGRKN